MKKKVFNKKTIISTFVLVILIIIIALIRFPEYKEGKLTEMKKLNNSFEFFLFLSGDCEVSYNKVEHKRTSQLPTQLRVFISYYNFYNDEDVTYDILMDEYYDFCDGKGERHYKNLIRFKDFLMGRYEVSFYEITPDNLDYNFVLDICQSHLLREYGLGHTSSEEYQNLT